MLSKFIYFWGRLLLILTAFCGVISCQEKSNLVVVGIFCINDFHGAFLPDEHEGKPGASNILITLDSLKKTYPHHVTIAGGDNFGGSFLYKATQGSLLHQFYKAADIKFSAIGNHEFDDGEHGLLKTQTNNLTYLSANIKDSLSNTPSYASPYEIYGINISETCRLNVGFIGLTTSYTPYLVDAKNIKGLTFSGDYDKIIQAYEPQMENADLTLLVAHIGTYQQGANIKWWDPNSHELNQIKSPHIHGIFTAHTHEEVCGRINEMQYPTTQAGIYGRNIAVMKIVYDTLQRKVVSVIPELCPVNTDAQTPHQFQCTIDSAIQHSTIHQLPLNVHLCRAETDMPHTKSLKYSYTELGDIVCRSYADAFTLASNATPDMPIIGIAHFGSIRREVRQGNISVLNAGEILPYANKLRAFHYTGKELKELLTFGLHNKNYGWMQSAKVEMTCNNETDLKVIAVHYHNSDSTKIEITDHSECIIVADDFMVIGGDGYPIKFFPQEREIVSNLPNTSEAFMNYLKQRKSIGGQEYLMKKINIQGTKFQSLEEINSRS